MNKRRRGEISITHMSGPLDGRTQVFEQPDPGKQRIISIGRRDGCDIHLPFDNQVSRLHARLTCVATPPNSRSDETTIGAMLTFWLEDAGSRNGTYIEKESEPISKRVTLHPGTLFRIGRTWLRLDIPLSFED
ncbi:MAG: FHA domain-containing protein [Anaerolineae bacterium]|nr:FHA domain-containing protein [Anaerolineae bacterium]MDW8172310.1 FHA domain-containing protein [Anaerolineae bacterium]